MDVAAWWCVNHQNMILTFLTNCSGKADKLKTLLPCEGGESSVLTQRVSSPHDIIAVFTSLGFKENVKLKVSIKTSENIY